MHVPSQGRKKGDDCMLTCIVESPTHEPRASDGEGGISVKFTAWWREEAAGRQRGNGGRKHPEVCPCRRRSEGREIFQITVDKSDTDPLRARPPLVGVWRWSDAEFGGGANEKTRICHTKSNRWDRKSSKSRCE
jgi:hypothetical protein